MATIQVLSDTHLEAKPHLMFNDLIRPVADILVLAGNIGNPKELPYQEFIAECSRRFRWVILICGSFEYRLLSKYRGCTVLETDFYMLALATSFPNVLYLAHGEHIEVDGFNFIGATLWTPISIELAPILNDHYTNQFLDKKTPWSVSVQNTLHEEHVSTIKAKVDYGIKQSLRNVVVTHHAPCNSDTSSNYYILSQIERKSVTLWIHGHSSVNRDDAIICSNQRGRGKRPHPFWRKDYVINLFSHLQTQ
jgi:hypothetical protein